MFSVTLLALSRVCLLRCVADEMGLFLIRTVDGSKTLKKWFGKKLPDDDVFVFDFLYVSTTCKKINKNKIPHACIRKASEFG